MSDDSVCYECGCPETCPKVEAINPRIEGLRAENERLRALYDGVRDHVAQLSEGYNRQFETIAKLRERLARVSEAWNEVRGACLKGWTKPMDDALAQYKCEPDCESPRCPAKKE